VGDVDPKARNAAIEPEAVDVVEGVTNGGVPPVEIRLFWEKVVQVILARLTVQAGPPKALNQLFGGLPSALGSAHTYQSRWADARDDRASTNHGCRSLL